MSKTICSYFFFVVVVFCFPSILCCSYSPGQCEWVYCPGDAISSVATSEKSTGKIFIYDGRGNNQPLHVFDKLHTSSLTQIRLNPVFKVVVSADKSGMIEYWTGTPHEYKFPKNVNWEYKTDTDLYEFAKCKAYPSSISFSPDGKKMATLGSDRKVRIFRFLTGKLMRVFDESLSVSWVLLLFFETFSLFDFTSRHFYLHYHLLLKLNSVVMFFLQKRFSLFSSLPLSLLCPEINSH